MAEPFDRGLTAREQDALHHGIALFELDDMLAHADGVAALRRGFASDSAGLLLDYDPSETVDMSGITDRVLGTLYRLGLDMDQDDERIRNMLEVAERTRPIFDRQEAPDLDAPLDSQPFFARAVRRVLHGLDHRSPDRLQLRPPLEIVEADLSGRIGNDIIGFLAGKQYTIPTTEGYPRVARRDIQDSLSPFWGFRVFIDESAGTTFTPNEAGYAYGGPNVNIQIPNGLLSANALEQLEEPIGPAGGRKGRVGPETVVMQRMNLGEFDVQFDTEDGRVEAFLDAISAAQAGDVDLS